MFNDITRNIYFDDVSELSLGENGSDWYVCIDWTSGRSQIICGGSHMSIPEQSF